MANNQSLDETLSEAWRLLAEAAGNRQSLLRIATLATVAADDTPDQRQVVVRSVDPQSRCITVHTDERAAKSSQIRRQPSVSLLLWNREARLQVRVAGRATLHIGNEIAQAAWDALPVTSRQLYRVRHMPGIPISEPRPVQTAEWSDAEAFAVFGVIEIQVNRLETLHLTDDAHIRARFEWVGRHATVATWLVP